VFLWGLVRGPHRNTEGQDPSSKNYMKPRFVRIAREFIHHLPYSAVGVAASLGILLGLEKMGWDKNPVFSFHVTHPTHIFLSAIVTTAMFWKYERKLLKAVFIGFVGVIPICSISDVFMPYLGGLLLKTPVQFHLCAIQEPWLVYPACFLGILGGLTLLKWIEKLTEFCHLAHVMVSSLASILYLISFDISLWHVSMLAIFGITLLSVWIPCCLSDIAFPLALVEEGHAPCCGHHPHSF